MTGDEVAATAVLSIGALADRTGVAAATLRMWETRHGFPAARRRASGHRRYDERDVEQVRAVQARRDAGVRLDVAIRQVLEEGSAGATGAPGAPSVFAELRRAHPALTPHQLSKRTLLSLSWAIEDEFCARAERAYAFGSFQREEFFSAARRRWSDIARVSTATFAMADFAGLGPQPSSDRLRRVGLPEDHPMLREWAVVCASPTLPVVLTAWELPGQQEVADHRRTFEAVWAVDADAAHDAARLCAQVCADLGAPGALEAVAGMSGVARPAPVDVAAATGLFNRVVSYLDDRRGAASGGS